MSQGLLPVSNKSMNTTISRAGVRHRLIQQIASRSRRSGTAISRGFTLIELLVVVIIVGILASVALPGFLNQASKAKVASAKSLAAGAAKECQVFLVEGTGEFEQTTAGGNGVTIPPEGTCTPEEGGKFTATIESPEATFTATVSKEGGIAKTCTGDVEGCADDGTW